MSSTEANYSYTTKIGGDLYTIRGDDYPAFKRNLSDAVLGLEAFLYDVATIQAGGHSVPVLNVDAPAAPQQQVYAEPAVPAPATPPTWAAPPAASPPPTSGHTCVHGERTFRTGQGAKGPWKAYFCPTPKGTPNQCEPEWVK